jgi:hypothetical protein
LLSFPDFIAGVVFCHISMANFFLFCFRSISRSICLEWLMETWACFSALLWHYPSPFGHAIPVLYLHLIEASSCLAHSQNLPFDSTFYHLMVCNKFFVARVLQAYPSPSSFDRHNLHPRKVIVVRQRSLAVPSFSWWQPDSRLADEPPH